MQNTNNKSALEEGQSKFKIVYVKNPQRFDHNISKLSTIKTYKRFFSHLFKKEFELNQNNNHEIFFLTGLSTVMH